MSGIFRYLKFSFGFSFLLLLFSTCGIRENKLRIALSKSSPNYVQWLKRIDPDIEIINLYNLKTRVAAEILADCDGLLLTGGEDIYPGWYGMDRESARCTEFNNHRDSLEMAVLAKSLEYKMPVFGICRGHQLINVYLGGKNIIDIPADYGQSVAHMCRDFRKCFHEVLVVRNSQLFAICGCDSGLVTTNHHQAAGFLSPLLFVNARSSDGLIEGIEWINPENKGFLMGVQWHPERMELDNPLSGKLARRFISECHKYSKANHHL